MDYYDYWLNIGDTILKNVINITNPTWPQLCLVVALLFIFIFRKNISNLLGKVKHIGKNGIDFDQSNIKPPSDLPEEIKTRKTNYERNTHMQTIRESIQFIDTYLTDKYGNDMDSAKSFLVDELATTYFTFRCQGVYNLIFGSQIQLLKELLPISETGLSKTQVNNHFNEIAETYSDHLSTWNLDTYLNFLIQANLITYDCDSYKITVFGVDFLTWLLYSGLNEKKPL